MVQYALNLSFLAPRARALDVTGGRVPLGGRPDENDAPAQPADLELDAKRFANWAGRA
jgi:hypothetical protein